MRGQFIDMQPSRGGIPARLYHAQMRKCDIERLGVPYVIGRIGWNVYGKRKVPIHWIFVHCSDKKKVDLYGRCLQSINYVKWGVPLDLTRSHYFKAYTETYGFKYPKSAKNAIKKLIEHGTV